MKKKLIIAMIVVSMLICVLAACGGNKTPECSHAWEKVDTTATCEVAGTANFKCSLCQATKIEADPALGHNFQFTETVKATCKTKGYDTYTCSNANCGATEKRNETKVDNSPAGHKYVADVQEPTCTKSGHTDMICEVCGSGDGNRETLPKLGHTYERADYNGTDGRTVNAPTCLENGTIVYVCTAEGCDGTVTYTYEQLVEAESELAELVKATGHSLTLDHEVVPATCTVPGYKISACANEGCQYTEQTATYDALGHTYTRENVTEADYNYIVTVNPTCITDGVKWVVCDDCDYCTKDDETPDTKYQAAVPATGAHVYSQVVTTIDPTCTEDGYTTYKCTADGSCVATENRDKVAALDHNFVLETDKLTDGQPTCKTNGDWPYACTRCDATAVNLEGKVNTGAVHEGYTVGEYKVGPTCISRAIYHCNDCGEDFEAYVSESDPGANPTGVHSYTVAGKVVASTCSEYGYTIYGCSLDKGCTATQNKDYTAKAAHTFGARSTDGTIECTECNARYIDQTTVIYSATETLCNEHSQDNKDPNCSACGIGVEITGIKEPEAAHALVAGTAKTVELADGAALIELKGEAGTTYTIVVYNKSGVAITTYDVVVNDEVVDELDVPTSVTGSTIVNITEIEKEVGSISVTASTDATVVYYVSTK